MVVIGVPANISLTVLILFCPVNEFIKSFGSSVTSVFLNIFEQFSRVSNLSLIKYQEQSLKLETKVPINIPSTFLIPAGRTRLEGIILILLSAKQ